MFVNFKVVVVLALRFGFVRFNPVRRELALHPSSLSGSRNLAHGVLVLVRISRVTVR